MFIKVGRIHTFMKNKISICLDNDLVDKIVVELKKGLFRSRSHIIEVAIKDYLKNFKGIDRGRNVN